MRIINIAIVLLVIFTLVSCAPVAKVVPTKLPTSTAQSDVLATNSRTANWNTYTSDLFLVTLRYPADWETNNEVYAVFSGQGGFFQLSASNMATPTAKEWCDLEMQHTPDKIGIFRYGTKPTMEVLTVDNEPACLVLPSDDQPQSERGYSLLVVEYPRLEEEGTRLLFFMADKNHIRDLSGTLKFVR